MADIHRFRAEQRGKPRRAHAESEADAVGGDELVAVAFPERDEGVGGQQGRGFGDHLCGVGAHEPGRDTELASFFGDGAWAKTAVHSNTAIMTGSKNFLFMTSSLTRVMSRNSRVKE